MEEWIFTFTLGSKNRGKCVRVKGTYESAREEMFRLLGDNWAFQYPATEWDERKKLDLPYPMETEVAIEDCL